MFSGLIELRPREDSKQVLRNLHVEFELEQQQAGSDQQASDTEVDTESSYYLDDLCLSDCGSLAHLDLVRLSN